MSRAAVVGLGAVTPVGLSAAATFEALLAGRSGIGPIQRFDARRYPVTFAAEVPLPGDGPALVMSLVDRVLDEALSGVDLGAVAPERLGVFMGVEASRPDLVELERRVREQRDPEPEEVAAHLPLAPTRRVAARVGARGPVGSYAVACTSSGQALGEALLAVRRGEVDIAVAGGVDVLVHPLMVTGFARLGALSSRNHDPTAASRPFDLDRDGFVLGEGAGMVVLVREDLAERVGPVLGWLSGYGCSGNAWRITDSPPDGRGPAEAMRGALADAGRRPEDVAYVNAHGTSTPQNDASEAAAIRKALGAAVATAPVSSTKSMMGHLVAACGVVEAIVALEAVRRRVAPPTANLDRPDPDCDLCHVRGGPRELRSGVALSNAFGFGGSNATLVMEAP
jgi:3-oxoacyl-[acyl-carrier-protein] synthase II